MPTGGRGQAFLACQRGTRLNHIYWIWKVLRVLLLDVNRQSSMCDEKKYIYTYIHMYVCIYIYIIKSTVFLAGEIVVANWPRLAG